MMVKYAFADGVELDEAIVAAAVLPQAPLAMPKQILETKGTGRSVMALASLGWLKRRAG